VLGTRDCDALPRDFVIQSGTPFLALGNSRKLQWMLAGLNLDDLIVPIEEPERLEEG
jgi:hypothetical protein